jgi:hypothetical protein
MTHATIDPTISDNIRSDPIILNLLDKIPGNMQPSFTSDQLVALKLGLGAREWGKHSVDVRGSFSFFRWRYYYVFLTGRNQRPLSRRANELTTLATAFLLAILCTIAVLTALLVLYLIKSALGIDIFPHFSLGIWGWFKVNYFS